MTRPPRRSHVLWSSVAVTFGCGVLALVCLTAVLRGRGWAAVPGLLCAAIAFREVRVLQRARRAPR